MSLNFEYLLNMLEWLKINCFLYLLSCCVFSVAQNTMRVHYMDGSKQDIAISLVDSVSFIDEVLSPEFTSPVGSWLWGSYEVGYYELLTFCDDYTYTGYDNYFTYGFETTTFGWYSCYGALLTLQSNGFGYQRKYTWFVTALTENAMEVMTKAGGFTYYRLQSEVLNVSLFGSYYFNEDNSIIFSDETIVTAEKNKITGLSSGTTYILVNKAAENITLAYKVIVK